MDALATLLSKEIASHPSISMAVLVAWFLATCAVNYLRGRYGTDAARRPGSVNGWLGILDPIAGNFWNLVSRKK